MEEKELKEILDCYAVKVRNSMKDDRYKEKQEETIKEIIKLFKKNN